VIYRFSGFEVDDGLYQLSCGGEPLEMQPKVFDLLLYLIANRDRVVSREELLEQVWEGVVVNEEALTRAVHAARTALGDDGGQQHIIRTVRRRGLRFVADVAEGAAHVAPAAPAEPSAALPDRAEPESSFIGRRRILGELEKALGQALAGDGRIALLGGEPGIGKTRTAEELSANARARGARVLAAWCYEGEGAPPYWPWVQILRSALEGLPEPPSLPPEEARFRIFDGASTFLRSAAARQPLMVFLDDLHWADSMSLGMLEFLARELAGAPLLVVGTYRDQEVNESLSRTLAELARHAHCERLFLEGFSQEEAGTFVSAASGAPPSLAVIHTLTEKTGGNPFLIDEIVALLRAEGRLGDLQRADALQLGVPPSVREVIRRRSSQLSGEARRLLNIGALIGQEFGLDAVEAVWGEPGGPQLECVEEALAAALIRESPHAVARYRFAHALIREALYEDLGLSERVRLHRRVGKFLESVASDSREEHLAELAFHFIRGLPGGGEAAKAFHYASLASERAERLSAWREAILHARRALEVLESLPDRSERRKQEIDLLLRQARSLNATEGYGSADAEELWQRSFETCEKFGDAMQRNLARFGLHGFYVVRAEYDKAESLLQAASREVAAAEDPDVEVASSYLMGNLYFMLGRFAEARSLLERGRERYDPEREHPFAAAIGMDPGVCDLIILAVVLAQLGFPEQALRVSEEALRLAEKRGHPFTMCFALNYGAILNQFLGRIAATRESADALAAFAGERGVALYRGTGRALGGWARVTAGEAAPGIARMEEGLAGLEHTGTRIGATYFHSLFADAYARAGRPREALGVIDLGLDLRAKSGERVFESDLLRLRGEQLLALSPDDRTAAEECFERALAVAREQGSKLLELRAATSLARHSRGKRGKANACRALTNALDGISEGLEEAPVAEARALLDQLS
jgi:DNA-binding winged helix-turn-helix (wHTH) protein/predicted ATPase